MIKGNGPEKQILYFDIEDKESVTYFPLQIYEFKDKYGCPFSTPWIHTLTRTGDQ